MNIKINENGIWYHGSNVVLDILGENSAITQWKELAKAFSHQPTQLVYSDYGEISHNGLEQGILYVIDEPIEIDIDIYQHPRTTMDSNVEFLTKRPLKVKLIQQLKV